MVKMYVNPAKTESIENSIVYEKWDITFNKLPSYKKITKEIYEILQFLKKYNAQKISKIHYE